MIPGGDANITCTASGSPLPRVEWRLGAIALNSDADEALGKNVLVLTNIHRSNNYTCVATSEYGTIEATAEVKVKGQPPSRPMIDLKPVEAVLYYLSCL